VGALEAETFPRRLMSAKNPFPWHNRPVFVTGGAGLVGNALVDELVGLGASVTVLIRDDVPSPLQEWNPSMAKVTKVHGKLEDQALMERILGEYDIKTVFHLAAQAIVGVANRNPISTFESNIQGTWSLLEACRRSPLVTEVVVASSDKAYGEQPVLPYTEDMPLLARNPYDVSKACTDMLAQSYAATYGMNVAISRCGNFFGEGDFNWSRIVPGTIRSIVRNERPVLRSDGTLIRDYFYVRDGAHAYRVLAEHLATNPDKVRGEAFNFSTDQEVSVIDLTNMILKLMKSDLKPDIQNNATHEILKQNLSSAKARKQLGWEPQYTLEDGLKRTIAWYERFLEKA
jgi:CDP-glucose 4,6-dehydratase